MLDMLQGILKAEWECACVCVCVDFKCNENFKTVQEWTQSNYSIRKAVVWDLELHTEDV